MTSDLFSKFGWVTYMAIFDCEWHSLTENVSYIYILLLTRFHHVHVSLLFLFISSYVCNDLSEIKNMFCSVLFCIIGLALSFWMKHLVIGQLQKPAKFSAFHWSTSRSQAFNGQLLGTSRVVHLPKRTVIVLFTISDA